MAISDEVMKRVKQYRNFPGYKNKTEAELIRIAEEKIRIDNLIDDIGVVEQFDNKTEQKEALELARKYLNDYTFEYVSDKNTLKQLIFLEVLNKRLQAMLNEFYKDAQSVPVQMMEGLHKNIMQITTLKETLGLVKEGKEEAQTGLSAIDVLKKKFKKWREDNNGSRTMVCPHCSKMVLLKIRTEAWEAQRHPYFKDRFLANVPLFDLLKRNRLTKTEVAAILETSEDYIDWIMTKLAPNPTIKDLNKELEAKTAGTDATIAPIQAETAPESTTVTNATTDEYTYVEALKTDLNAPVVIMDNEAE